MEMNEIWKDIEGYEGLYQVSNLGRVKSFNYKCTGKEKILKPYTAKNNRVYVNLSKCGKVKNIKVHRLVATAFIPNYDNLPQVNHKDEDPTNNNVNNLEWCTAKYNCNYGNKNSTSSKAVKCVETGKIFKSAAEASRYLGLKHDNTLATYIKLDIECCGYHWEYING